MRSRSQAKRLAPTFGRQCLGGLCVNGFCASCQSDAGCGSNNYCFAGTCYGKVGLGVLCAVDNACLSGHCFVSCVQCKQDSHCGAGVCLFNKCVK